MTQKPTRHPFLPLIVLLGCAIIGCSKEHETAEVSAGLMDSSATTSDGKPKTDCIAQWVRTVNTTEEGYNSSNYYSIATDAAGNVYAAGSIWNDSTYAFSPEFHIKSPGAGFNAVLVKYDTSGAVQWLRTVTTENDNVCIYQSVAADPDGNIYVSGYFDGNGPSTCSFGPGVSVTAPSSGYNAVIVKYDPSGCALWARTVLASSSSTEFDSLCTDAGGNVYAAGYIDGAKPVTFGLQVTATGTCSTMIDPFYSDSNAVLVKYNASGEALWARTVITGSLASKFSSVVADNQGNVITAGLIRGMETYTFGPGVIAKGYRSKMDFGTILVKYNASGEAQWVRTGGEEDLNISIHSIDVDTSGNIIAAGSIQRTSEGYYAIVAKFDPFGEGLWYRPVITVTGWSSAFYSVKSSNDGTIYTAGGIDGTGTYAFAPGVWAAGTGNLSNIVVVQYSASGTALWAQTMVTDKETGSGNFSSIAPDSAGNVYAAGCIQTNGVTFSFAPGVSATAITPDFESGNAMIVKYARR